MAQLMVQVNKYSFIHHPGPSSGNREERVAQLMVKVNKYSFIHHLEPSSGNREERVAQLMVQVTDRLVVAGVGFVSSRSRC